MVLYSFNICQYSRTTTTVYREKFTVLCQEKKKKSSSLWKNHVTKSNPAYGTWISRCSLHGNCDISSVGCRTNRAPGLWWASRRGQGSAHAWSAAWTPFMSLWGPGRGGSRDLGGALPMMMAEAQESKSYQPSTSAPSLQPCLRSGAGRGGGGKGPEYFWSKI